MRTAAAVATSRSQIPYSSPIIQNYLNSENDQISSIDGSEAEQCWMNIGWVNFHILWDFRRSSVYLWFVWIDLGALNEWWIMIEMTMKRRNFHHSSVLKASLHFFLHLLGMCSTLSVAARVKWSEKCDNFSMQRKKMLFQCVLCGCIMRKETFISRNLLINFFSFSLLVRIGKIFCRCCFNQARETCNWRNWANTARCKSTQRLRFPCCKSLSHPEVIFNDLYFSQFLNSSLEEQRTPAIVESCCCFSFIYTKTLSLSLRSFKLIFHSFPIHFFHRSSFFILILLPPLPLSSYTANWIMVIHVNINLCLLCLLVFRSNFFLPLLFAVPHFTHTLFCRRTFHTFTLSPPPSTSTRQPTTTEEHPRSFVISFHCKIARRCSKIVV